MADGDKDKKGPEKRGGPEWNVRISSNPNRLRRDTAFLCNIRFKNDLPEIPCDPKLLLPPYDRDQLAAFKLTELERDLRKDLMFEDDLGIPIHPWNIEQYSVPEVVPPLHPDDAALVESDEEAEPKKARLRGDAAELSWLLRTKYIAAEAGLKRGTGAPAKAAAAAATAAAAGAENEDPREERIRQIEAQFVGAKAPLAHGKDPSVVPLEVMPVFPDSLMEGRSCVLATFDNDPLADVDVVERMPAEQRARVPQAMQLKSFKPATGPQFVALLVPKKLPEAGDDELSASGGIPGPQLAREYHWVREYQPHPRLDEKSTTYLFRFAGDGTVQFHDLNTRLELRKRKRQAAAGEDDEGFMQPEMVVVRDPETGDWAEQREARERAQNGAAASSEEYGQQQQQEQQEQQQQEEEDGGGGAGAGAGGGGSDAEMADAGGDGQGGSRERQGEEEYGGRADANAALRDVFGDDDDDI
ncbi:hypothetical protein CHLNCDRAFT_138263 [Chlorella variabilis]|uniref:RNA polymerase II-associated factor 1 homolog n=1 Tax=Chlorella variabilis TaxID=554065 RepID=E1ZMN4_CHLVA|nr:hypothetical protein CHLNCDRAFT_138263 [Chlorella variabilis]EFN52725.1 hypothetical protein CHLNCDRAFT_138263 [Chlorella variabilis]|eukprot:XP_005844827.1 hypothetical protein CHLNCDRAFT_138263 [Chlorella variabilis]